MADIEDDSGVQDYTKKFLDAPFTYRMQRRHAFSE